MKTLRECKKKHWYQTWIDWSTIGDEYDNASEKDLMQLLMLSKEQLVYLNDMDLSYDGEWHERVAKTTKSCIKKQSITFNQYKMIRIFLSKVIHYRNENP